MASLSYVFVCEWRHFLKPVAKKCNFKALGDNPTHDPAILVQWSARHTLLRACPIHRHYHQQYIFNNYTTSSSRTSAHSKSERYNCFII